MFRSSTIIRELIQSLAKVTLPLKHLVKLRRCIVCGDVAAWCHISTQYITCRSDNYVYFHVNLNFSKSNKTCICW